VSIIKVKNTHYYSLLYELKLNVRIMNCQWT